MTTRPVHLVAKELLLRDGACAKSAQNNTSCKPPPKSNQVVSETQLWIMVHNPSTQRTPTRVIVERFFVALVVF